jgi:branched-chain amino acid aminotransferase
MIYIDGSFYQKEEAKISVYDHGLLYGDGVFEGIRIYNGRIFRLREHLERLYDSARAIMLSIPMEPGDMHRAVEETVTKSGKTDGYIRLVVTRGKGDLGVSPSNCKRATVIIIVDDIQLYPEELYEKGISIITAATRRVSPDCFDPRIKSLNYLNNVLAKLEAQYCDCSEAVMLNQQGHVTECTGDNIFIIKAGLLMTPAPVEGALGGIPRSTILEVASSAGVQCKETVMTRYDLYTADECFLTGTGAEIIPVTSIDGRTVGGGNPGPMTRELIVRFRERINSGAL